MDKIILQNKNIVDWKKSGFPLSFSKKLINDLVNIFIFKIKEGNLNIKNIGSFKILKKKQRLGRNPKTKEQYIISSRNSLSFHSSKNLLASLNRNE